MRLPDEAAALRPTGLSVEATLGRYELRHAREVTAVAWSADGTRLATSSLDATVRLWDCATGALLSTFHGPDHALYCVALSSDGRLVVAGGASPEVFVWSAHTGKVVLRLPSKRPVVHCVAVAPDGRTALVVDKASPVLFSLRTGAKVGALTGHASPVTQVAWSADGALVATAGTDRKIKVHHVGQRRVLHTLEGPSSALEFTARGLFSAGLDRPRLWSLPDFTEVPLAFEGGGALHHGAASADGSRVLLGGGSLLQCRQLGTGRLEAQWEFERVGGLAFSPRGDSFAAFEHGGSAVRVFEVVSQRQVLPRDDGHVGSVVALAAAGRVAASLGIDRSLLLWDLESARLIERFGPVERASGGVAMDARAEQVAAAGQLWRLSDGSQRRLAAAALAGADDFSPDGAWLVHASGTAVDVVRLSDGELVHHLEYRSPVRGVRFFADGKRLVLAEGRLVHVTKITGVPIHSFHHPAQVTCVAPLPGTSLVVSGGGDGALRVWDALADTPQKPIRESGAEVLALAASAQGLVASISGGAGWRSHLVELWDVSRRKRVGALDLTPSDDAATALCFTPDGKRLLAGTSRGVVLVLSVR